MKKALLLGLAVLLSMKGSMRADATWCKIDIYPEHPTSADVVYITLSGKWGDGCVPNDSNVTVVNDQVYFDVTWDYPPSGLCLAVISSWELIDSVGPLVPGTYTVSAGLFGWLFGDIDYDRVGEFTVTDRQFVLSTDSLTVPEGQMASFTVRPFGDPGGVIEVNIARQSGDDDIAVVSGATLVFDSSDYFQPKTVTLSVAEDLDYVNGVAQLHISAEGYVSAEVTVTEGDNDTPAVVYVDVDARGGNNGRSWEDAFVGLTQALTTVSQAPGVREIRIAQGTYTPGPPAEGPTATFHLVGGVCLEGGYAGFGEDDPNARDISADQTILSGDLAGNDPDFIQDNEVLSEPNRAENCYHTITVDEPNKTFALDGLRISYGNARGRYESKEDRGGGMFVKTGNVALTDCTFTSNSAYDGGGLHASSKAVLTITNCVFKRNWSYSSGGAMESWGNTVLDNCTFAENISSYGGAFAADYGSLTTITRCTFNDNSVNWYGGAVESWTGDTLAIDNCIFCDNSGGQGGALFSYTTDLYVTNCLFTNNSAQGIQDKEGYGGAIYSTSSAYNRTTVKITNCTIVGNTTSAEIAGGIFYSGGSISNCILWGNRSNGCADESAQLSMYRPSSVNYSCVQGWTGTLGGNGNIETDPCLAQYDKGDYHLRSQAGRWDANEGRWAIDEVTSPCIDAGDPMTPIGPEPFPNAGIINMGAYGGTAEASKSYFGEAICETIVAGDINGDCIVNASDFALMASHWLLDNTPRPPDQPASPTPPSGTAGVILHPTLSWQIGAGAIRHDVYFGTASPGMFRGTKKQTTFDPGRLSELTTYYWRIDEINTYGKTLGPVWTFETGSPARNPNPADGSTGISTSAFLSWTAGDGAEFHEVYFGTTYPLPLVSTETDTTYAPPVMARSTTYYWRIDEVNSKGKTTGETWSFVTETGGGR